ncbi:PaaI family thioesterase [Mycobacterium sp. IS-3022]|uniref:PaaI family thioesterase n=1 Tax=Mycobacterium sp. IS-3022 TaxID=1772277 RepID=UPI000741767C|nr:PaaI family thioesterase [Mycobacterium sp. IS-3022]KUI04043.1 thioesterase [Mycobacterium sp. IS-3022]
MTTSELEQLRSVYEPLTESVRRLIDVSIRTHADEATVKAAIDNIDCAAEQLESATLRVGSFGLEHTEDGALMAWGNVVMGVRNPVAPPLIVHHQADGSVWADFVLGAAFEGAAGHVHGGVCAMLLDHVLGATAHKPGMPAVTGTLTLRYRRGTRLGRPLRAAAHVDRVDGVKTFAVGNIADDEGVTVEAEGIFIHPGRGTRDDVG